MEIQDALVIWCDFHYHPKTRKIPERIGNYLEAGKQVFYAPGYKDSYPPNFPIDQIELILSSNEGLQDSAVQQDVLVERLRKTRVNKIEICGPLSNLCLMWLKHDSESKGFVAEINPDYSITLAELFKPKVTWDI